MRVLCVTETLIIELVVIVILAVLLFLEQRNK